MGTLFEGPQIKTSGVNQALASGTAASKLKPVNLNAGGLKSRFSGNSLNVSSTGARKGLVNNLSQTSLNQADLLAGLRGQVGDATSGLTASRLAQIEDARKASASNLRDNLARRKILGSSFAGDAQTRNELDFARQREQAAAEGFLQEIDLKNQLINQEFDVRRNAFSTKLDELNLQADLGAKFASLASSTLQASAQLRAQLAVQSAQTQAQLGIQQANLDAQAQAGAGNLFGLAGDALFGPALDSAGTSISSSLFG